MKTHLPRLIGLIALVALLGALPTAALAYRAPYADTDVTISTIPYIDPLGRAGQYLQFTIHDPVLNKDVTGTSFGMEKIYRSGIKDGIVYLDGVCVGAGENVYTFVYDPARGTWMDSSNYSNMTILSTPVKAFTVGDGIVAFSGDSQSLTNPYVLYVMTYDPGPGLWMCYTTKATGDLYYPIIQDGIVAYTQSWNLLSTYTNVGMGVYDPRSAQWVFHENSNNNGYLSLWISEATVYWGDGSTYGGYDAQNGWVEGEYTQPIPYFVAQPKIGAAPLPTWLTDMSIGCTSIYWGLGLYSWSTARSLEWTFPTIGTYSVSQGGSNANYGANLVSQNITVQDGAPPTGTITINDGAAATNSTSVTLNLSATDDSGSVAQMYFSNDNTNQNWQGPFPYSPTYDNWQLTPGDGWKNVFAKFVDPSGNESQWAVAGITVDTVPPTGTIGINNGLPYTNYTTVSIKLTAQDSGSGVKQISLSNNGTAWVAGSYPPGVPFNWGLAPGDGPKTVYAKIEDNAGNDTIVSSGIILESAPPTGSFTINDGNNRYTNKAMVTLHLSYTPGSTGSAISQMSISNDSTNYSTPEPFAATKNWTLPSGEGWKAIWVNFYDQAGNITNNYSAPIYLDLTPPVCSSLLINGGAQYCSSSSVSLSLGASDNASGVSQMSFSNDGVNYSTPVPCTNPYNWTLAGSSGLQTVYAKVYDGAGNVSQAISASITLDSSKAYIALLSYIKSTNIVIGNYCSSNITQVSYSNDNVTYSTPVAIVNGQKKGWTVPAGDGSKTVWAKFYDNLGNVSPPVTATTILDTTLPTGNFTINGGAQYCNSAKVALNMNVTDSDNDGVAMMGFADTTPVISWRPYAPSVTYALPTGDGPKTVYGAFWDRANNCLNTSATITLDTVPPTGSIAINGGAQYCSSTAVTLTLNATDATSGVDKMSFSSDGVTFSTPEPYAPTRAYTLGSSPSGAAKSAAVVTGEGLQEVYVKYYDKAGNVSPVYSATITLDSTAPTGSLTINGGAQYCTSTAVTLTLAASDAGSGLDKMSFSTDGASYSTPETYAASKSYTLPGSDGLKTVYVKFYDKAGNVSTAGSAGITLDTTGPTASLKINGGATSTNNAIVTLNLSASDGSGSGVNTMSFSNDNIGWSTPEAYATSKSWSLSSGDGAKTVYAKFTDKTGNTGNATAQIVLDTSPPSAGSISINGGATYTKIAAVTLSLSASGATQMRFSSDNSTWTVFEPYATTKLYTLPAGDGTKAVFVQFGDDAGNHSDSAVAAIVLDATPPVDGTLIPTLGKNQIILNWSGFNDATSGIATYRLYYSATGFPAAIDANKIYEGTAQTFTQTVPARGNYYYLVVAVDKAGNVSPGATASVKPKKPDLPFLGILLLN